MVSAMQSAASGSVDINEWDFQVLKISAIDPTWAIGSATHKTQPDQYEGELFWLHEISGSWKVVDSGTGLEPADVGAPSDLSL
jgi:hypothetical protein